MSKTRSSKRVQSSSASDSSPVDTRKRSKVVRSADEESSSAVLPTTQHVSRAATTTSFPVKSWKTLFEDCLEDKEMEREVIPFIAEQFVLHGLPLRKHDELVRFLVEMEKEYNDNVYHNFLHAVHVTLNCAFFLNHLVAPAEFGSVERLALLFAAVIHDAGHLGVGNNALIRNQHELALRFHDQSVAEMHSLSLGLGALQQGEHSLVAHFTSDEKKLFRRYVIDLVLATDIADPFKKKVLYDKLDAASDKETGALDLSHAEGKSSLLGLILRTSDVGSSMQSEHSADVWAHKFYLETKLASIKGDGPPVNPTQSFGAQISYFEHHSHALVHRLMRTGAINEDLTTHLNRNVDLNLKWWMREGHELLQAWESDPVVAAAHAAKELLSQIHSHSYPEDMKVASQANQKTNKNSSSKQKQKKKEIQQRA